MRSHRVIRRGSMMLEFVLVMPIAFVLVMMVLQFAHIWMARQVVKYASYCAARATLTARTEFASAHAYAAAKQVCAWVTFADSMTTDGVTNGTDAVSIPGWGTIPNSSTVDARLSVTTGSALPWEARTTVAFKFPLLMPVVGETIHLLVNETDEEDFEKEVANTTTNGLFAIFGEAPKDRNGVGDFPYLTLTETCVLPKPYSTDVYPLTSADLDIGYWMLRGGTR